MSVLIRNVQLTEKIDKLKRQMEQLKRNYHFLEGKADRLKMENEFLYKESRNYQYLKAEFGEQRISEVIEKRKAAEVLAMGSRQRKREEISL